MSMNDLEDVAKLMVKRFVNTKLYPTDTPTFRVDVMACEQFLGSAYVFLQTTLPDDMLYSVTWAHPGAEPVLKAYKEIHVDELIPH